LNLLFNCFMKSGILEPEARAIRLIKVADTIQEPKTREMAKATTFGIISKFLSPEQMLKLSEVFKKMDLLTALFDKLLAEEVAEQVAEQVAKAVAKEVTKEKSETAKRMLENNVAIELIAKVTKLSPDIIKSLQVQL